jgi:hypothetical protein
MIYDLKEKKFIIPDTKDIPSRMSFGNHPHKLCHIMSKHNKVCDNCQQIIKYTESIYYCSLCDFVICNECFSKKHITEGINKLRNDKVKFSNESKNFINQQNLNSTRCKIE